MLVSSALRQCGRRSQQTHSLLRLLSYQANGGDRGSSSGAAWQGAAAAAAVAAASLAGVLSLGLVPVAHGDADYSAPLSEEQLRQRFQQWMAANGADWTAAEVEPSNVCGAHLQHRAAAVFVACTAFLASTPRLNYIAKVHMCNELE
jgi:hypothetical protein